MSPETAKNVIRRSGFSLIEVIVAFTIMAVLAGAVVPVMFNKLEQARYERIFDDLQAIYEATMGTQSEDYFGFVGDMGSLPDSIGELIDSTGQGADWRGPYLSLAGGAKFSDVYGNPYVIDTIPIRVRSFGPNGTDNSGAGDDINYPENPLSSFDGILEAQVYINGRLIGDAAAEQVTASISYSNDGTPADLAMTFDTNEMRFGPDTVHQGKHVLTVIASTGAGTTIKEVISILPGATTELDVFMADSAYMTRLDTDLNNNGIADRKEDQDGDGIPNSIDPDIDGDGSPNSIDPDSLDPFVTFQGGSTTVQVNAVTPSFGNQGDSGVLLTIDGAYFADSATVNFSGTGITVLTSPATFVSSSQLTVSVNISGAAATGLRNVTVDNTSGSSGIGTGLFEIVPIGGSPSPIVNSVNPDNADQGETALTVALQGQNFLTGPTVTFSNGDITVNSVTFVNSSQVDVNITISGSAATGLGTVRLTNTDASFDEGDFTVNPITPNISSATPNNGDTNTSNIDVTITGTNFLSGIIASTTGSPLSVDNTTYVSSSQIIVRVDAGFSFTTQQRYIVITNPGGGADSTLFTVNGLF